jgi:hypothetical protein
MVLKGIYQSARKNRSFSPGGFGIAQQPDAYDCGKRLGHKD